MSGGSGFPLSRRQLLAATPLALAGSTLAGSGLAAGSLSVGETSQAAGTRRVTLYAEPVGDGYGYGYAPGTATVPGPTIVMQEGERLEVRLVNRTRRKLSLHAHGVDYDAASDGTPVNDGCVDPGASRTYVWRSHPTTRRADGTIRPGTAGYWHYHDHCLGSEHGTEGVMSGLYGALLVRRRGDLLPVRRPFVVVMLDATINGKVAPHTPTFSAHRGERVEFVVIGHGNLFHTFHLHGHRWAETRTGQLSRPDEPAQVIDTRTIGPAESFGFQVIAGEDVGAGMWMYHCHVQYHADAGMAGMFLVREADGSLPSSAATAARRFGQRRPTHSGSGPHHTMPPGR